MAIESEDRKTPVPEDESLVRATLAGDNRAFGALYDRYIRLIWAVCLDATRNATQVDDLCQETFLQAYRQLHGLRKPTRFGAWLTAIARHSSRKWLRRRGLEDRTRADADLGSRRQPSGGVAAAREDLARLQSKLLELPEKERLALQLCYLCEEPAERAQSVLGLSRSGLYAVLERARQRLKRLMGGNWEERPDE